MNQNPQQSNGAKLPPQNVTSDVKTREVAPLINPEAEKVIALLTPRTSGVTFHRQTQPFSHLSTQVPYQVIQFDADIVTVIEEFTDFLDNVDMVMFSRIISTKKPIKEVVELLHKHNIVVWVDSDDYWDLGGTHILKNTFKTQTADGNVVLSWVYSIKYADIVTVTHERLKAKCLELNKNVEIVENAINAAHPQYAVNKTKEALEEKICFGWQGSLTHLRDVSIIGNSFNSLSLSHPDTFKLYVKGKPPLLEMPNELVEDADKNKYFSFIHLWMPYRRHFLGKMRLTWEDDLPSWYEEFSYGNVDDYATFYNNINVSLIPIEHSEFNSHKSHLKLIEAGFGFTVPVVSNRDPYREYLDEDRAVVVKKDKYWHKELKNIIENPEEAFQKSANAYLWSMENFEMNVINVKRIAICKRYFDGE